MKKIGLLTFLSNNYGTCLQAFAMRKAIECCGKEVLFINYERNSDSLKRNRLNSVFQLLKKYSLGELFLLLKLKETASLTSKRFACFKDKIVTGHHKFSSIEELSSVIHKIDSIVCGSDMIWSPEFEKHLDVYLLKWCNNVRRISYAPSVGNIAISDSLRVKYANALSKFDCLSCREKSGADFIKSLVGKNVPVVVDPTLLFDSSQWLNWFPSEKNDTGYEYILVYCFGGLSPKMRSHVETLAEKHHLKVRYILSPDLRDTYNEKKYGDGAYGPEEYVGLFKHATFTIVNGYHGLLFSLIFEKPFVVLHRETKEHWGKHENRMSEVLSMLNWESRYLEAESPLIDSYLELDYSKARNIIKQQRDFSWNYLRKSLQ